MIDLDWIRELIDLVDESGIDTLEVSRFTTRVRISKSPPVSEGGGGGVVGRPASSVAAGNSTASPEARTGEPPAAPPQAETPEVEEEQEAAASDLHEVTSPMVGTFYRAPAPDAPPYVETGERVQKGQTLCILEAMKLMNELESEVTGVIEEICVENAEPVEYGQVLFRVDGSP